MLSALNIGASGMGAYATALKTISDNVANLNTPGFKAATGSFASLVNGGGGTGGLGGAPAGSGGGVAYTSGLLDLAAGQLNTSADALDLAVDGRGFLVAQDAGGGRVYLRTGQFEIKDHAIVQRVTGRQLMLRTAAGGVAPASTAGKETSAPEASTAVRFNGNLSVDTLATEHTVSGIKVYDALGGVHQLSVLFAAATTQADGRNQKAVTVSDDKGNTIAQGKVAFSLTGTVDSTDAGFDVTIEATGGTKSTLHLDFLGLTGFSSGASSSVSAGEADGKALGTLTGVQVTEAGALEVHYSNGKTESLGQVLLADLLDAGGLHALDGGGFRYEGTLAPALAVSSQDGLGKVVGSRQEASNVDLTAQFGELILVQRGFQASSQIVSAANEMLGQLFEIRSGR